MRTPKILFFGHLNSQVGDVFRNINSFFEVTALTRVPHTRSQLRKYGKYSLAIILHDPPKANAFLKLKELRAILPEIPIIFLALNPSREEIVSAVRMGVADIFILPVPPDELISGIYKNQKKEKRFWQKGIFNQLKSSLQRFTGNLKKIDSTSFSQSQNNSLKSSILIPIPTIPETKNIIKVQMLGEFQVSWNGTILKKMKSKKAIALFAFLLLNRKKRIHKHILMNTFWRDSSRDSAKNCMHVMIHSIRKYLNEMMPGYDFIIYQDDCYSIHPEFEIRLDTDTFTENWRRGNYLEKSKVPAESIELFQKSFSLYQNDFLFEIHEESWVEAERDNYKETFLVILDRLSAHFYRNGNYSLAINLCKDALKKDPCLEEIHRRLMRCYQNVGMRDKAIRQFHKCEQTLERELDMKPSEKTIGLLYEIKS